MNTNINSSANAPPERITSSLSPCRFQAVTAELLAIDQLCEADFESWSLLEKNSLDGNPYLSPSFVKSALTWLNTGNRPLVCVGRQGEQWIGCGLFCGIDQSLRLPMPHLRSWCNEYSFLDSMLLHREHAEAAANGFWKFMLEGKHHWQGVEFLKLPVDSPTAEILATSAATHQVSTWNGMTLPRAALVPAQGGEGVLMSTTRPARAKGLKKG